MSFDQLIYEHKMTTSLGLWAMFRVSFLGVLALIRSMFLKLTSQLFPFNLRRHIYLLIIKRSQGMHIDFLWT